MSKQQDLRKLFGYSSNVNLASGTSSAEDTEDAAVTSTSSTDGESGEPCSKLAKIRKFQDEWFVKYTWLKRSTVNGMLCDICTHAKASNPFTTAEGCTNYQNSTLVRHQESKSHIDSVLKLKLRAQLSVARENAMRRSQDRPNQNLQSYVKQLRTVYMMAKRDISADIFTDLMQLQVLNGIECDYYKRPQVLMEFEECIESVLSEKLIRKINESEFFGIMLDETCDITVEKKLAIYIKYIENGEAFVSFLGNELVHDCTASGIENALTEFLSKLGISDGNLSRLFGLGTDGAAVMTGRVNGLGVKLKSRNQYLVQVHCVAHRLNLAVSQAARDIDYCKQYHAMIHTLYAFYSNSSVRYDKLRALQTMLHGSSKQITEPTSVRWLSIEAAVKMIFSSHDAIVMSLDDEKGAGKSDALFKFVATSLFVLFTALLIDVLTVMGILSLTFQKDAVNFSVIRHSVQSAEETLKAMKTGSSTVNEAFSAIGDIPVLGQKSKYNGVEIVDNEQMRQRFTSLRDKYLDKLIEKLTDRFPSDELNILECFDMILNPGRQPENHADLNNYGVEQLNTLCEHYSDIIDSDKMLASFLQYKHLIRSYKNVLNFDNFAKVLINDFNEQYPGFVKLAKIAMIIPVSSAACERGFSVQNAVKTKSRNRLSPVRLNRLMFIKLVGPNIELFEFEKAARMFSNMKERRN